MELNEQILDQPVSAIDGATFVKINLAGAGKRFLNYIIDMVVCYVLVFIYGVIWTLLNIESAGGGLPQEWILIMYLLFPAYYIIMEASMGKTVGKFVTKTRVVTVDNQKPGFLSIVGRTLCRIIPFEPFSLLGSKAVGWHDSIPNTRVIIDQ